MRKLLGVFALTALALAVGVVGPDAEAARGGSGGAPSDDTVILFLDLGCSATITCNDDGSASFETEGCSLSQVLTVIKAAGDICAG